MTYTPCKTQKISSLICPTRSANTSHNLISCTGSRVQSLKMTYRDYSKETLLNTRQWTNKYAMRQENTYLFRVIYYTIINLKTDQKLKQSSTTINTYNKKYQTQLEDNKILIKIVHLCRHSKQLYYRDSQAMNFIVGNYRLVSFSMLTRKGQPQMILYFSETTP